MTTAELFIDYQNVHMSAWETFTPYGAPVKEAQIHPAYFANEVLKKRSETYDDRITSLKVWVYRGLPNPRKEGRLNSIVTRQHTAWRIDPRVEVKTRPLRYPRDWPNEKAEEKGIDVLLAISLVQAAISKSSDRLLVASRDTDLLPALELAESLHPGSIGIVTWHGQSALHMPQVPSFILGETAFKRSRDQRNYGAEVRR